MRLSFFVQLAILVILGCGVYNTANQYQTIENKVQRLDGRMEQEHENIRVLQAEWAFLTSPVRLEKIAASYLQLQAIDGRQFAALGNIPLKATLDAVEAENQLAQKDKQNKTRSILPPFVQPELAATPVSMTGAE